MVARPNVGSVIQLISELVADYCECGNAATQLCGVCGQPTCNATGHEHQFFVPDIAIGHGFSIDVLAQPQRYKRAVCPTCTPRLALREYDVKVSQVLRWQVGLCVVFFQL